MPLENIGSRIDKLTKLKHSVNIYIKDKKISIPNELVDDFGLFVGKVLTNKEYDDLDFAIKAYPHLIYASRLLNKRLYTEYKLSEKLKKREASKEEIIFVLKSLKKRGYLNDIKVANEYVDIYDFKNYGKNKIKAKLIENGVNLKQIQNIQFNDELEYAKAKSVISSLNKRYKRHSYNKRRELVYKALISKGYESHIATSLLKEILKDDEAEIKNLKETIKLYASKYKNINSTEAFTNKVISSCINKGYNYEDINNCLKEYLDEVY